MPKQRPSPEKLLKDIQLQEDKKNRGRLKIFFGACAGVGKTYAMLSAAHLLKEQNFDVVVGFVETHGRSETAELLTNLELLPRRTIEFQHKFLPEFDLEGALKRQPTLILVDELAHSNIPGSRHHKRWQDVEELLKAGIDVYSTLNVQHLESLNDVIGHITGVRVYETIPDFVFDNADEVTLVDLPPDELLQRLREGKVYVPAQTQHAIENFFRKGNLIALRELALRRMADRVDVQMREYRTEQSIEHIWQAKERIMVCVGPHYISKQLIRKAYHLATMIHADWLAVYIETPKLLKLSKTKRDKILKNLKFAQELGADTKILAGEDRTLELITYARERNVTKIIVGKPLRSKLSRVFRSPLSEQLIQQMTDVDIYVVGYEQEATKEKEPKTRYFKDIERVNNDQKSMRGYFWSIIICAIVTLLSFEVIDISSFNGVEIFYLLGIVVVSALYGRRPSILASLLSTAAYEIFFAMPSWSVNGSNLPFLASSAVMLCVTLSIGILTSNLRHQAKIAMHRERRTSSIYAMSKELSAALTRDQIVEISTRHLSAVFQARVTLLLPDSQENIQPEFKGINPAIAVTSYDLGLANWVYHNRQPAGFGTQTLPASRVFYMPLTLPTMTRGVIAITPSNPETFYLPEMQHLLNNFATQIALSLDNISYLEAARDALVAMETERLRNSLLHAISHDLRQPLTDILDSSRILTSEGDLSGQDKQQLAQAIHDKTKRIHSLVTNLLDMARLQIGNIELKTEWCTVKVIIEHSLERSRHLLELHNVSLNIPDQLSLLHVDPVLIESTLSHLLENCSKFTAPGCEVFLSAEQRDEKMWIYVDDNGPGLPKGMEEQIFEKFTRGDKKSSSIGAGLGLAICRAIIEAHGGRIHAENRMQGGARFCIWLPIEEG